MRVLGIEDRVFVGLPSRQVDIEIHGRVGAAQKIVVPDRVGPHLVDQFLQQDDIAGALADLHELAFAFHADQLDQYHDKAFGIDAKDLDRLLQAAHLVLVV